MRFYLIWQHGDARYAGTLTEARQAVRDAGSPSERVATLIDEVDVATDKANMLRILNQQGGYESHPLRSWCGTTRGGIKRIAVEDR